MKDKTKIKLATGAIITGLVVANFGFFEDHISLKLGRLENELVLKKTNQEFDEGFSLNDRTLIHLKGLLANVDEKITNYPGSNIRVPDSMTKMEEYLEDETKVVSDSTQAAIMTKMFYELIDPMVVEEARRVNDESILADSLMKLIPNRPMAEEFIEFFDRDTSLPVSEFCVFYEDYMRSYYLAKYGTEIHSSPMMNAYYNKALKLETNDTFTVVFKNYFAKQETEPTVDLLRREYTVYRMDKKGDPVFLSNDDYINMMDIRKHIILGDATMEQQLMDRSWDLDCLRETFRVLKSSKNLYGSTIFKPLPIIEKHVPKVFVKSNDRFLKKL